MILQDTLRLIFCQMQRSRSVLCARMTPLCAIKRRPRVRLICENRKRGPVARRFRFCAKRRSSGDDDTYAKRVYQEGKGGMERGDQKGMKRRHTGKAPVRLDSSSRKRKCSETFYAGARRIMSEMSLFKRCLCTAMLFRRFVETIFIYDFYAR